jgi:hypothetical protein
MELFPVFLILITQRPSYVFLKVPRERILCVQKGNQADTNEHLLSPSLFSAFFGDDHSYFLR